MQTPLQGQGNLLSLPVSADTFIECGTIVCAVLSTGMATPGGDTAGTICLGVAEHDADNSDGDAGAIPVACNRRDTWVANSSSDPVAQAQLGSIVYVQDPNTISKTGGSHRVVAGVMVGLSADSTQVCVDFSIAIVAAALLALGATLYAPHS